MRSFSDEAKECDGSLSFGALPLSREGSNESAEEDVEVSSTPWEDLSLDECKAELSRHVFRGLSDAEISAIVTRLFSKYRNSTREFHCNSEHALWLEVNSAYIFWLSRRLHSWRDQMNLPTSWMKGPTHSYDQISVDIQREIDALKRAFLAKLVVEGRSKPYERTCGTRSMHQLAALHGVCYSCCASAPAVPLLLQQILRVLVLSVVAPAIFLCVSYIYASVNQVSAAPEERTAGDEYLMLTVQVAFFSIIAWIIFTIIRTIAAMSSVWAAVERTGSMCARKLASWAVQGWNKVYGFAMAGFGAIMRSLDNVVGQISASATWIFLIVNHMLYVVVLVAMVVMTVPPPPSVDETRMDPAIRRILYIWRQCLGSSILLTNSTCDLRHPVIGLHQHERYQYLLIMAEFFANNMGRLDPVPQVWQGIATKPNEGMRQCEQTVQHLGTYLEDTDSFFGMLHKADANGDGMFDENEASALTPIIREYAAKALDAHVIVCDVKSEPWLSCFQKALSNVSATEFTEMALGVFASCILTTGDQDASLWERARLA